jgi:hypothetical protein
MRRSEAAAHLFSRRHRGLSLLWTDRLVAWLRSSEFARQDACVLDYGCGLFDLAPGLAGAVGRVIGWDPDPSAIRVAQERCAGLAGCGALTDRASIPQGAADIAVLNSVTQYFEGPGEMGDVVAFLDTRLRPGRGSRILIVDIIPPRYCPAADALDTLRAAAPAGLFLQALVHLAKAALLHKGTDYYKPSEADLVLIASGWGFELDALPRNLTPSRQRYSVMLRRRG